MAVLGPDERDHEFYSDAEAAVALSEGLKHIADEQGRIQWRGTGVPYWIQQENDRAIAKVKAAVRYLCADEE